MERMYCQNRMDNITQDFSYWDDPADDHREQGSLYPLWRFTFPAIHQRKLSVTALQWSKRYTDMFYVGYGPSEFPIDDHNLS